MLTVVDLDPGRANYYLARAKVEYLQGDGAEGLWYGQGCAQLGLSGQVKAKDFTSLFHGFLRGKQLVQSAGKDDHVAGKDFAFSAPKSVSTLWAVADAPTRGKIEQCQLRAVKRALDYLEEKATVVRMGKGGRDREAAGIVTALWQHGTSRAEDPDLHHHATVFNLGLGRDGKTRTTDQMLYFVYKMAGGAAYRCELARELQAELGLQLYRPTWPTGKTESWFEVAGVPAELMWRWSTRSREIAEEAAEKGLEGAKGKQIAALSTREQKKRTPAPMPMLFARWKAEASEYSFSQESVTRAQGSERDEATELAEAVAIALTNVTTRASHFAERDLLREVAIEAQGRRLSVTQVMRAVTDTLQQSPEVVRLGTVRHEPRYSTREVFAVEAKLLSQVVAAKGKNAHVVREKHVKRAIRKAEAEATKATGAVVRLTDEQRAGVNRLTRGEDQIAVLNAPAGTGKSLTTAAAKRAFELGGYRSIELGGKGQGVKRLLEDLDLSILDEAKHHIKQIGRAALTALREDLRPTFLRRFAPRGRKTYAYSPLTVDSKTVVLVDRAELVSVKQLDDLARKVLERGGKLCLIGDARQGEGLAALPAVSRILGEATLTVQFRQRDKADREALRALSRGEAKEALKSYAERGRLHVATNQQEAMRQMVADWSRGGVRRPGESLLVCSTDQERRELNRLAQAERKKGGQLGRKSVSCDGQRVHVGDRVVFQKTATYLGVERAIGGEVLRIGRQRITRKTFHGRQFRSLWSMLKYAEKVRRNKAQYVTVRLDSGKVLDIPLDLYGSENLSLGYAATTRRASLVEADKVFLLTGPGTSRETLYAQAARSRLETRIYTDRASAGRDLEELVKQATKSRKLDMAHDLLTHPHEERRELER